MVRSTCSSNLKLLWVRSWVWALIPNLHLLVQSQQWKHHTNVSLFWCFHCWLWRSDADWNSDKGVIVLHLIILSVSCDQRILWIVIQRLPFVPRNTFLTVWKATFLTNNFNGVQQFFISSLSFFCCCCWS